MSKNFNNIENLVTLLKRDKISKEQLLEVMNQMDYEDTAASDGPKYTQHNADKGKGEYCMEEEIHDFGEGKGEGEEANEGIPSEQILFHNAEMILKQMAESNNNLSLIQPDSSKYNSNSNILYIYIYI